MKLLVPLRSALPLRSFLRIERIVRHYYFTDAGQLKNLPDMRLQLLPIEKFASFLEGLRSCLEPERVHDRNYPASRFRNGGILHEQRSPDQIGLLLLIKRPIFARRGLREPKQLSFQVVVCNQLIDAPQAQLAERRHE